MIKQFAKALLATAILASAGAAVASPGNMGPTRAVVNGNAFYDDYYGPFYDGYWSVAGEYFFTTGPERPYVRDDGRHFSRVMASGSHPVEGLLRTAPGVATASR